MGRFGSKEKGEKGPSPAMVVAVVALIVALGGTSYAAIKLPENSVGTKQIKKNAVTVKKIKKNAVRSAKVKNRSLLAKDFKKGQLPKGANGATGATGPAGPIEGTPAGGSLSGTYPNPNLTAGAVGPNQVAQAPAARASTQVPVAVPNSTSHTFVLFAGPLNQDDFFDNDVDAMVIPQPGIYVFTATLGWAGDASGTRQARILVNGDLGASETVDAADGGSIRQSVTLVDRFEVGDQVQVGAFQNSGGNLNTSISSGQGAVNLAGTWLSP